jgi:hypothetical protein
MLVATAASCGIAGSQYYEGGQHGLTNKLVGGCYDVVDDE